MLTNFGFLVILSFIGLIIGVFKNKRVISAYNIFIIYNLFYITTIIYVSIYDENKLLLSGNLEIINNLIISVSLGVVSFIVTYNLKINESIIIIRSNYYNINKYLYFIYLIKFLIIIYFAENYGWHQVSRVGIQNLYTTLFAYLKYSFIVISIFLIWNFYHSKNIVILVLTLNILVAFFDGGRTTLFGLIITYLWLKINSISLKNLIFIILITLVLLLIRSYQLNSNELLQGISDSIEAEGIYGSYNALQFLDFFNNNPDNKIYGLSYILDPFIYLLPRDLRNEKLFLQISINSYSSIEPINLMGGFYWVAESIANFGIYGSIIVGFFYGYITAKFEKFKDHDSIYTLLLIASMTCLLAKSSFANLCKISLFYVLYFYVLRLIFLKKNNA
jgi:hypothetical protein